MQSWRPLALLLFISSTSTASAWSQSPSPIHQRKLTFDAVSIRQIEAFTRYGTGGTTGYLFTQHKPCVYSEDKVLCQLSLEELVREAYQRKRYEVTGPEWLAKDVFVFQAVLPDKTNKDDARLMMRAALEDRFGLRSHLQSKRIKTYLLVAGPSGPHLVPADPPERQKKIVVNGGPASFVRSSSGTFAAVAIRLDDLGPWIERSAGLDGPVLNRTGLDGQYKIDLHWDPINDTDSLRGENDTGIVTALKAQAGLVLNKEEVPVDVLVVDAVSRTPTPN
jgi:uncharacterized protein (TIGR03435 family)